MMVMILTKTNYILVESIGEAPIAKFIATPTSGTVPLPVNFTDQSENNPTNWQWDFGDGNSSNQQNPIHTYNIGGSYTVSLTVHNNHGNDTKTDHIIVEEAVVGIPCPGIPTITYEGQTYNTVQIESQCWLKENLNVGTSINGNQNMENNTTIEKYCLNNDVSNCDTYGGLYQWDEMMHYSTIEGFQGICPDDWHIPTDDEWKTMEMALGMTQSDADNVGYRGTNQGEQMKSTTGWNGTNTSRFTALPGSHRNVDGSFSYIGSQGGWWSSSESTNGYVGIDARLLSSEYDGVYRYSAHSGIGYSVRCVKNF